MAPRTAKTKKAPANESTKKSDKSKNVDAMEPVIGDSEVTEDAPTVIKNKQKQTKKASNEKQINGINDENPPVKKGRKNKVAKEPQENTEVSNSDTKETDQNGHGEEIEENDNEVGNDSKNKKKPKKTADKANKKQNGKEAKDAKQDLNDANEEGNDVESEDEKTKPTARGRARKAQIKVQKEELETLEEEEVKEPLAKRSKKTKQTVVENNTNDKMNEEMGAGDKKASKEKRNQTKKDTANEEILEPTKADSKKKKGGKKDAKTKDTPSEEVEVTKGKRGQKKVEITSSENCEESTGQGGRRKRKTPVEKAASPEPKEKVPKNKNQTNYESIDFSSDSKTSTGKEWNFKISSWNVDGIRAWLKKGGLDYIKFEKPDILCLQEVKCAQDKLPDEIINLPGYHTYWLCSDKDGYAGVGIYTTKLAINVQYGLNNPELDGEGRIITAEYEQFYLICTYVPNAGRKLVTLPKRLQWNAEFRKHVKELDSKKPVIICGDMNVAHNEIDLKNPKTNRKNAGFTDEERAGMTDLLGVGFVDTFRHIYPDKSDAYTFWTYMMNSRAKNVGWRLDYSIISERLLPSLCDNVIRNKVYGSDHCPITLFLHLNGAMKPTEEFSPK